jgi:hypothetical protein
MSSLSISAAWDDTRSILIRDGRLFAAVALALIVLPEVVLSVVGAPVGGQATELARLTYAAVVLLGFVGQLALNRLAIGPPVTVGGAIAIGFARFPSVLVVLVLLSFSVIVVGVALLMILGAAHLVTVPVAGQPPSAALVIMLILMIALAFAIFQLSFPIATVETGNPLRLMSRSWHLAKGHYGRLLAFILIIFFCFAVVVIASQFGVGSVVGLLIGAPNPGSLSALVLGLAIGVIQAPFTVIAATMIARIYVQLAGRDDSQVSVPSSGI